MRHHAPGGSRTHHPAQRIKHFSQVIAPLSGIFRQQGQVWCSELPFVVSYVTRVGLSDRHATILPCLYLESLTGSSELREQQRDVFEDAGD
jgi:hypothetical protein